MKERCAKLECCNPASIGKTFAMVKSVKDCIAIQNAGEPTMKAIARTGGEEKTKAMVSLNIAALDRFLHLKNPLSEDEIDFIAEQIVDEFGATMTFGDMYLIIKDIKSGKYGKLYERLSAPDILGWFRQYYNDRFDIAYEYNVEQDKKRYTRPRPDVLRQLGYTLDSEGHVTFDMEVLKRNDERRREAQNSTSKDNEEDYKRYKAQLIQNGYKPLDE